MAMHSAFRFLVTLSFLLGASACLSSPDTPAEAPSQSGTVAPQLERLAPLVGTWDLSVVTLGEGESHKSTALGPSSTRIILNGFLLETKLRCDVGGGVITDVLFQWSYDPFMKVYRVAITEGAFGYMDIYEGVFDEGGTLLLTNEGMATPLSSPDGTFAARYRLDFGSSRDEPGYTLEGTFSMDGGETWSGGLEFHFIAPRASRQSD